MKKNGLLVCILIGWEEDVKAWECCTLPILPKLDLGIVVEGKVPLLHLWRAELIILTQINGRSRNKI